MIIIIINFNKNINILTPFSEIPSKTDFPGTFDFNNFPLFPELKDLY